MTSMRGSLVTAVETEQRTYVEQVEVFLDDLDSYGMVHHAKFATLAERGTISFFVRHGASMVDEDMNVVVRELSVRYDQPITAIGPIDFVLWCETVGRTSARFGFRIESGGRVHASGHRVLVKPDFTSKRPVPWSDEARQFLSGQQSV
jgi:acyl-CoA thioester hydrolase